MEQSSKPPPEKLNLFFSHYTKQINKKIRINEEWLNFLKNVTLFENIAKKCLRKELTRICRPRASNIEPIETLFWFSKKIKPSLWSICANIFYWWCMPGYRTKAVFLFYFLFFIFGLYMILQKARSRDFLLFRSVMTRGVCITMTRRMKMWPLLRPLNLLSNGLFDILFRLQISFTCFFFFFTLVFIFFKKKFS